MSRYERANLFGRWRQTDQIKREPADQGWPVGIGRWGNRLRLELAQDERVDRVAYPARVPDGGHRGTLRRHIGPVGLVLGALFYPLLEQVFLSWSERLAAGRRGHPLVGVLLEHPRHQLALIGLARDDGVGSDRGGSFVEPELRLAAVLIGAVAGVAILREDRSDITIELDSCPPVCFRRLNRGRNDQSREDQNHTGRGVKAEPRPTFVGPGDRHDGILPDRRAASSAGPWAGGA